MSKIDPLTDGEQMGLVNLLIAMKAPVEIQIDYINWRGEETVRRLRVGRFWHGSTEWHPEPGLMLKAFDLDKNADRDFRVTDFNLSTLRKL